MPTDPPKRQAPKSLRHRLLDVLTTDAVQLIDYEVVPNPSRSLSYREQQPWFQTPLPMSKWQQPRQTWYRIQSVKNETGMELYLGTRYASILYSATVYASKTSVYIAFSLL